MTLTRKEFLSSMVSAAAGLAGAAVLVACGSSEKEAPDAAAGGNCAANGTGIAISANHGHAMTVTKEDVAAGVEKTYQIQGTSDHPHTVVVTAAMFATLQTNASVSAVSSNDGTRPHTHPITITCV